jgi:hypothetical protein
MDAYILTTTDEQEGLTLSIGTYQNKWGVENKPLPKTLYFKLQKQWKTQKL